MDSHQQKSRFLRNKGLKTGISRAARVAAATGLVVGMFGPLSPFAQPVTPASADNNLNWEGVRPPYAPSTGSTAPFTSLDKFGVTVDLTQGGALPAHPIAVAPNGDIFVAGRASAAVTTLPAIYKSTDGGKSWTETTLGAGTQVVTGIAVAPKYPSDNVVVVSVSDGGTTAALNSVMISINGGIGFSTLATEATLNTDAVLTAAVPARTLTGQFMARTVGISPNFDNSTGAGVVVFGGSAATGVDAVYQIAVSSGGALNTASGQTKPLRWAGGITGAVTGVNLAFSPDYSNDGVTSFLYSCIAAAGADRCNIAGTFVTLLSGGTFNNPTPADKLGTAMVATEGSVAFPTDYRHVTGGATYYAATGDGFGGNVGDIFKHTGGQWNGLGRNQDFASLSITGTSSNVNLLGSVDSTGGTTGNLINIVHRSTSAGDSFTTTQSLNGEKKLDNVAGGVNMVAMAPDFATSGIAYGTLPGALGGVVKTTNKGSNWVDTGLTDEQYNQVKAIFFSLTPGAGGWVQMADSSGANSSLFWTDNVGTTSTWVRVHRSPLATTNGVYIVPADVKTASTIYFYDKTQTNSMVVKTSDNGRTWDTTSSDPFSDAKVTTMDSNSATRLFLGDDKGRVWNSNDGGSSWQQATTVLGQRVTSFRKLPDFGNKNTIASSGIVGGAPEVFLSEDGAVTFKQIGSSLGAWGTTQDSTQGVTIRNAPDYFTNKLLYVRCNFCSDNDVWRLNVASDTTYTRLGVPTGVRPLGHHSFLGGVLYMMGLDPAVADSAITPALSAPCLDSVTTTLCSGTNTQWRTFSAPTITDSTWSTLALQSPPVAYTTGVEAKLTGAVSSTVGPGAVVDLAGTAAGHTFWYGANNPASGAANAAILNQIASYTWTNEFLAPVKPVTPPDLTNVPTNVGNQGTPTTFTWSPVNRAQCFDFQLALDKDFNQLLVDPISVAGACPTGFAGIASNSSLTISQTGANSPTQTITALVQGNTYFWRVRVRAVGLNSATAQIGQGPWSVPASFAVGSQGAPTSPEPQLPADGSTMPNLGPTVLSWNNPAGTVQFEINVIPLNQDGPGIDLIIGDPAVVGSASYTIQPPVMGQGNYIILPGATYNWRIRTTNKSGSLSNTDPSWGPWSTIRSFKTPRPSAASITLNPVTPSATPTVSWKDSNVSDFYYEVQLSEDKTFNVDPATATAAVYWNLVHGGISDPLNSWKTPAGLTLEKGKTYFWRVRQRVQATPNGPDEVGIGWTATASFVVP